MRVKTYAYIKIKYGIWLSQCRSKWYNDLFHSCAHSAPGCLVLQHRTVVKLSFWWTEQTYYRKGRRIRLRRFEIRHPSVRFWLSGNQSKASSYAAGYLSETRFLVLFLKILKLIPTGCLGCLSRLRMVIAKCGERFYVRRLSLLRAGPCPAPGGFN